MCSTCGCRAKKKPAKKGKKKGDMSIGVIIAVAIGLIILVVIAVMIFRSGNNLTTATACTKFGGTCRGTTSGCGDNNYEVTGDQAAKDYCGALQKSCCKLAIV